MLTNYHHNNRRWSLRSFLLTLKLCADITSAVGMVVKCASHSKHVDMRLSERELRPQPGACAVCSDKRNRRVHPEWAADPSRDISTSRRVLTLARLQIITALWRRVFVPLRGKCLQCFTFQVVICVARFHFHKTTTYIVMETNVQSHIHIINIYIYFQNKTHFRILYRIPS